MKLGLLAWLPKGSTAVVLVLVAAAALVRASIPDASGVLHGCFAKNNGQLRLIDLAAGDHCNPNEVEVNWNAVGPQGVQGPPGPPGLSGYEIVTLTKTIPASSAGNFSTFVGCPFSKKVLGGGYEVLPTNPNDPGGTTQAEWGRDEIWGSQIVFDDRDGRWYYYVFSTGDDDDPYFLRVYATCAVTS